MKARTVLLCFAVVAVLAASFAAAQAQEVGSQPQIPTLQVCNPTKVTGKGLVKIDGRVDAAHSGTFVIGIELGCDPSTGYPVGRFEISRLSMSDSLVQGSIASTTIEQVTTTGKHTPTAYLNGRCRAERVVGCRFWMMVADNGRTQNLRGTPDIVGFLVFDATGQRVAYGTGPIIEGDIRVAPSPF